MPPTIEDHLFVERFVPGITPSENLGGKGRALAALIAGDYPVPASGAVTTVAYRALAAHPTIASLVERIADGAKVPATEVDAAFDSVPVDEQVAEVIGELARSIGDGGPIAVRSSATVEDLHGSSFAGQYRSLLDVDSSDEEAVLVAVRRVWASLWHPAPTAYRRAFAIDEADVAMAVVLMKMIPATTAGVVFTVDPGGTDGARVEAVEGLGESLVSGERTPSAWVVPLDDDRNPALGSSPDLPIAAARALTLALDIERSFDTPQDVEWAADGDDVFVVQARPITVLDDDDGFDTDIDDHELTTAGIVEMVPGVLPPLRWELNRFLLEEAFRSVLDSLGVMQGNPAEDRPFVRRVRGRVAIDFDQLREVAASIPGAAHELEQQYFGQSETQSRQPGKKLPGLGGLRRELRTLRTQQRVVDQAEMVIVATRGLRNRRPVLTDFSDGDLLAYARRLIDLAARGLAAELGVAAAGAASYRRLELQLSKHLGDDEGTAAAQTVIATLAGRDQRTSRASAAVFAGPSWEEIGSTPPALSEGSEGELERRRAELEERIRSLPGWLRRRILTGQFIDVRMHIIRRTVSDVTEQLRRREETKAAVLELGGETRRAFLELGNRLVEADMLTEPEEVELMTTTELADAVDSGIAVGMDAVRQRRNWLSRYEAEGSLPVRFTGIPDREPEPLPEGDVLTGWAASPGRRRGLARVVVTPNDRFERGEILVAEATDASWSPLFVRAGAIVVERGGPLSHAAILARELGLPAVLNLAGATGVLDRCTISVDGNQGVVVIEQRADESP